MPVILSTSNIIISHNSSSDFEINSANYYLEKPPNVNIFSNSNLALYSFRHSQGTENQTEHTIRVNESINCDILIVGGGGGGGQGGFLYESGGGGAGGIVYMVNKTFMSGTYKINVGNGGNGGSSGFDSSITLNNLPIKFDDISLVGKGGGAGNTGSGGSGGGGGNRYGNNLGGSATQGNTFWNGTSYVAGGFNGGNGGGYNGGGGGGASEIGNTDAGQEGGDGREVSITGSLVFYGGGGGGAGGGSSGGSGGGGGTGGWGSNGGNGTPHTGGGGGGVYKASAVSGGKGGSGIVIIKINYGINNNSNLIISGNVGIGTFSPQYKLDVQGSIFASTGGYTQSGLNTWTITSDRRIKENIIKASYTKCLENVKNIELYKFNFKNDILNSIDKNQLGFIAQEVKEFFPNAVENKIITDKNGKKLDLLTLNTTQIDYTLYGAIKQLIKKVEILEQKLGIENNVSEEETETYTYVPDSNFYVNETCNILINTNNTSNTNNSSDTSNIINIIMDDLINFIKENSNYDDIKAYIKELNYDNFNKMNENDCESFIEYLKNISQE